MKKLKRPPMLLSLTLSAATLTLAINMNAAIASSSKKETVSPKAESAATSRMGASIADDVAKRSLSAREQARTLDLKEQAAKAAQARLNAALKVQEKAKKAEDSGQDTKAGKAAADTGPDQFDTLARIYQAMKPKKAAPVFEQLDLDVQTVVAQRMRERSAAQIMAAMSPKGAARLSMALAGKTEEKAAPAKLTPPANGAKTIEK